MLQQHQHCTISYDLFYRVTEHDLGFASKPPEYIIPMATFRNDRKPSNGVYDTVEMKTAASFSSSVTSLVPTIMARFGNADD